MTRKTLLFTLACALSLSAHAAAQRKRDRADQYTTSIRKKIKALENAKNTRDKNLHLTILNQALTDLFKRRSRKAVCQEVYSEVYAIIAQSEHSELNKDEADDLAEHCENIQRVLLGQKPKEKKRRRRERLELEQSLLPSDFDEEEDDCCTIM